MTVRITLRTMNQYLAQELDASLVGLTDRQILYRAPAIDERCIRDIAIHAHRPVLAVATTVAGYPWPSRPILSESVSHLYSLLDEMAEQVEQWLSEASDEAYIQPVDLRWGTYSTGAQALINSLAHGLVHAGAIRGVRAIGGFPTPPECS